MGQLNVAIIHDWIKSYGGSERLLVSFSKCFGKFDVYTTIYNKEKCDLSKYGLDTHIYSSFISNFFFKTKIVPSEIVSNLLGAITFEAYDLSKYNLVISNSHAFAHGVITNSNQTHIVYSNTPMRYVWSGNYEYKEYIRKKFGILGSLNQLFVPYLRMWDYVASQRADHVVSISNTVKNRVKKYYKRDSIVIYPPVNAVDLVKERKLIVNKDKEDYYITIGRLVKNKNVDLIIKCFNDMPQNKLVVVGDGSELKVLKKKAKDNIKFTGFVDEKRKYELLSKAKGFVFCANEDFGIAPIEALALGVPVIAYIVGGIKEHLVHRKNGIFFDHLNVQSLTEAIIEFEKTSFDCHLITKTVEHLSEERFIKEWKGYLDILGF